MSEAIKSMLTIVAIAVLICAGILASVAMWALFIKWVNTL